MNLFLFKIYIIRGYSPFCVPYVRVMPQRQEKSALIFIISSEVQTVAEGGGEEESKETNMQMKSPMVKIKTKTS